MTEFEEAILGALLSVERGSTTPADASLLRRLGLLDERGISDFGAAVRDELLSIFKQQARKGEN